MKYAKLTIIIAVLSAVIAGVVVIVTTQKANDGIEIKASTEKERKVIKDIQDKITKAPDNKFCPKAYDDVLKTINLFFKDEVTNKKTYTNELQSEYTEKFVKQAMCVFDHNEWKDNDIKTIRKEYSRCKSFAPDNSDLNTIKAILNDYDSLSKYNSEVHNACQQQPKCVTINVNYLYVDDDWDISKTNDLIGRVPSANSKVTNSPVYKKTRKSEVEKRLKSAHKQFVDTKMDCAESEAIRYNYNSSRHGDYTKLCGKLEVNFKTYCEKWGESRTTVLDWQKRRKGWEIYAPDPETM